MSDGRVFHCDTVMDQQQRNFDGRSQQFWSSVLSGHLDLPIVGGDALTLPTLERSLTRGYGAASWWRHLYRREDRA